MKDISTAGRERLQSRMGFILLAAGCAIGLGNVWRFPFIVGQYGGGAFVMIYLGFLFAFGLPIVAMELAIGRGARQNIGLALRTLEPPGTRWHWYGPVAIAGNYLLMMFYTVVAGWLLAYFRAMTAGTLAGLGPAELGGFFSALLADPLRMAAWATAVTWLGMAVCGLGLQRGVERVNNLLMALLLAVMAALAIKSLSLPGAGEGLAFYLRPDLARLRDAGIWNAVNAAMGQAFFTLSLGIGSLAIIGSYTDRRKTLLGESAAIVGLDTLVALISGLIIFPACFAFGVAPDAGPSLIFITLPNIFNTMTGGQFWGALFFVFLCFAALSTVIAVFENIVSYWIDVHGWSRRKAAGVHMIALPLLALPCVLGFNAWSGFQPLGAGTSVLDFEDFIVSKTLLPMGALVFLLFCSHARGWGWHRFRAEADAGQGWKIPPWLRGYVAIVLPILVLIILIAGYVQTFSTP